MAGSGADGIRWESEEIDAITICVDQHESMAGRSEEDTGPWASGFLEHNRVVYESAVLWRDQHPDTGVELVNLVGDAAVFIRPVEDGAGEDALGFAQFVIDRASACGLDTSIGMAVGRQGRMTLIDRAGDATEYRQLVGRAVDVAVRLSWLAKPHQLLITNWVRQLPGLDVRLSEEAGDVFPTVAAKPWLDKWIADEVAVFSVHWPLSPCPPDGASYPVNVRKVRQFLVWFAHFAPETVEEAEKLENVVKESWDHLPPSRRGNLITGLERMLKDISRFVDIRELPPGQMTGEADSAAPLPAEAPWVNFVNMRHHCSTALEAVTDAHNELNAIDQRVTVTQLSGVLKRFNDAWFALDNARAAAEAQLTGDLQRQNR